MRRLLPLQRSAPLVLVPSVMLGLTPLFGGCQTNPQFAPHMSHTAPSPSVYDISSLGSQSPYEMASWETAPQVALVLDRTQPNFESPPIEPGTGQLAYDDHAIYLRVDFVDRDICTLATADHQMLYGAGDIAEWFIGTTVGPHGEPGEYLELHVAPNGIRSAYHIARPGLIQPLSTIPFTAKVVVRGTLNDSQDHDTGWTAIFTLPWETFREISPAFADLGPDTFSAVNAGKQRSAALTTLISRYNYGRHLPYLPDGTGGPELTMWPSQPTLSFHLRPFHASLRSAARPRD